MHPSLLSSQAFGWQTPESVLALVRKVGPIGLDPCTAPNNPTGAWLYCSPKPRHADLYVMGEGQIGFDGLREAWSGKGLVYVNPPYGRALPHWTDKILEEVCAGAEIIALVPSRTDTQWWQRLKGAATHTLLWRGRIKFKGGPTSAPFPSAIFYFGPRDRAFREAFADRGVLL